MEKSIKRVEKLVHATNSALAQMKFSLMFDDLGGEASGKLRALKPADPSLLDRILDGDDLKHCQDEFKAEASQMLAKVETMAASKEIARKNSKAVDRIKEINTRMNSLRLEHSKQEETERSRQKLLNLINEEKFSPGVSSDWDSARTSREKNPPQKPPQKPPPTPKRTESLLALAKSPGKSTDELKSKILETQEIVDRGFQTARQLAQKVETMSKKEKTPTAEKTVSEINLRSLESNETPHSVKCKRKRREERKSVEIPRVNARVIDVKSEELGRCRRVNLQMQRLPSLNIRGGLQLQKVHSLEIPAGGDGSCPKSNTAVSFLAHDQLEYEKMGEMIEKVRKENCCCSGNKPRGSYVECFNCGKLIRIRETAVDPRKVDEILQQCNFNVFDPRIDEFVEKCGTAATASESRSEPPAATHPPEGAPAPPPRLETPAKETRRRKKEEQPPKVRKSFSTLRSFSDRVLGKYKKEAETLESNHLKLDSILQNLFRQVDESREVFQKCHLLEGRREHGPGSKLTATKPVLVSLTGTPVRARKRSRKLELKKKGPGKGQVREPREATEVEKERGRTTLICVSPVKLDKEEALRVVTPSSSDHTISGKLSEAGKPEEGASSVKSSSTSRSRSSKHSSKKEDVEETLLQPLLLGKEETQRKYFGMNKKKNVETAESKKEKVEEEKAPSETLSSSGCKSRRSDAGKPSEQWIWKALLKKEETERKTLVLASGKSEGNPESDSSSENNYESDFESVTNEPNGNLNKCEEEEAEAQAAVNKLSTISEVDSDLERRLSDEAKTIRSSKKMETEDEFEMKDEADAKDSKKGEEEGKEKNEKKEKGGNSAEASIKSTPTELVTSLKDILSALQDQFVRTESLAEKLTENVRSEEAGRPPSGMPLLGEAALSSWKKPVGAALVENLRSARKDSGAGGGSKSPRRSAMSTRAEEKSFSADSLSDEGGSSLGEIVVSERKRKTSEKSGSSSISECSFLKLDSVRRSARVRPFPADRGEANAVSPFKLEIYNEEVLYSEGEVPSDELLSSERLRTTSVGEVISGKNCTASTVE